MEELIMRGRIKNEQSYNENIAIKITKEQKDVWIKNEWIRDEIRDIVRKHIDIYTTKK